MKTGAHKTFGLFMPLCSKITMISGKRMALLCENLYFLFSPSFFNLFFTYVEGLQGGDLCATTDDIPRRSAMAACFSLRWLLQVVIACFWPHRHVDSIFHYARVHVEATMRRPWILPRRASTLELRKISNNPAQAIRPATEETGAVQFRRSEPTGSTAPIRTARTPWVAPNPLLITSVGTLNGVSRTVRITAKGYPWAVSTPSTPSITSVSGMAQP